MEIGKIFQSTDEEAAGTWVKAVKRTTSFAELKGKRQIKLENKIRRWRKWRRTLQMVARGPVPSGNEYLMGRLRDDGDGSRDEQQYRIIGRQERKQNDVTNIEESRRGTTHT